MKILFYLDNSGREELDYSNPELGNPGVGGTQFMIWSLVYFLKKYNKNLNISLAANNIKRMFNTVDLYEVKNIEDAIELANKNKFDILILRGPILNEDIYIKIEKLKVKTIIWTHNFDVPISAKLVSKYKYIVRNVCVGKEQYDRLRDHEVFKKSTYIFNGLDFSIYEKKKEKNNKDINICYVGSLVKDKGFHKIAKVWSQLNLKDSRYKLMVIGNGKLYNSKKQMGKYGIAEGDYEKKFLKYIVDENGYIKKDITFYGVLGNEEKINVMSKADIGIANPTGKSETFCIVAVEFQALGIPVISAKKNGLLDTIKNNKSGILVKNNFQLYKSIVKLGENQKYREEMGNYGFRYVRENFNMEKIAKKWLEIFEEVYYGKENINDLQFNNIFSNLKIIRELNRKLKLPSLITYRYFIESIIRK
ncbi:glycosyltransferase family 4 protein [Clostridium perfringens]|uniref:glycosyltransferase family 4 protein n=1 Tax=Clostridium perfringens TaxID=1502 RepID=UPI003F93489C